MSKLTDFLIARIANDERDARNVHDISVCPVVEYDGMTANECDCGWPEGVLAECEAKRRIVKLASLDGLEMYDRVRDEVDPLDAEDFSGGAEWALGHALRVLALPYADHPDYCEEWRP